MKLLADECCDAGLVKALRDEGYDVTYVLESMCGASDLEVLQQAWNEKRILLTEDKDFGTLVYRLGRTMQGIILLRFAPEERALKISQLRALLSRNLERLSASFVVLDAEKAGIRPLT